MRLSDHIAAADGWLRNDAFMDIALFDPTNGYYSESILNIGSRGDFSTTATLAPLLARRLVSQWKNACIRTGKRLPFIEIGAGNGDLARAISQELGFWQSLRTKYLIVERSANLSQLQRFALGNFVRIYTTMEQALTKCKGEAFIFCNELVDAFPARRFIFQDQAWQEIGLSVVDRQITEVPRPCNALPTSSIWQYWNQEGQIVEVHDSYTQWIGSWIQHWNKGSYIVIDYGDFAETLYKRRPKGSLRGYRAHQELSPQEIYSQAGHCDITCDVNFSDIAQIADNCIGDQYNIITQHEFLAPQALDTPAEQYLISRPGPGDHFRVLIQWRH